MQQPALVVMAAGMGSRFGGLKQIEPVDDQGHILMDFSLFDAYRAGFRELVFIIKPGLEESFRARIGSRMERYFHVHYVFQTVDQLPEGYCLPEGRVKPWGTGHAVLCCRQAVREPFAVINADDYYGQECFRLLAEFLQKPQTDPVRHFAMAGYRLSNTLTENGYVSRGICEVDATGRLTGLTERTKIELRDGVPCYTEDDGASWTALSPDDVVSMNCWAFPAGTLDSFEELFRAFLDERGGELKSEFYLPSAVNFLLEAGTADVQVLRTRDKWYGMTYAADHEMVRAALAKMTAQGVYPAHLWD